jgi:hypothetical protein
MNNLVFVSHAAVDNELALHLKKEIESRIPTSRVFCSGDPADLPPGAKWPEDIQEALKNAKCLVLVATERSMARTWPWFETGTVWFSDCVVVPLCFGTIRKGALMRPLDERMALNADSEEDLAMLFQTIATRLRLENSGPGVERDLKGSFEELERLANLNEARSLGWIGVPWDQAYITVAGPIERLRLLEDAYAQSSMEAALRNGGYDIRYANPRLLTESLEKRYLPTYLTDRQSWRKKITNGDLILVARPPASDK